MIASLQNARQLIGVAFLLLLTGCGASQQGPRPNIVLITIDALRPDHMSCYGYERNTTPFIDGLAQRGTLFSNAYATASWTAPSMASLLSGLYPRSHGVHHGVPRKKLVLKQEILDPTFVTLPEVLQKNGYSTFGLFSNGPVSRETGMAQGYDRFRSFWFRPVPPVQKIAMAWKPKMLNSEPFFLWIHYFDPHSPYNAHEPWISTYSSDMDLTMEWQGRFATHLAKNMDLLREDPEIVSALIGAYDSEINFVDDAVRKLLEDERLTQNSMVIVASDHGEAFLDHNHLGHGHTLHEEEIRIPLIVVLPESTNQAVCSQDASLVDIYPTILDYLEVPVPPQVQGRSLMPWLRDPSQTEDRSVVCELGRGYQQLSIKNQGKKLMRPPGAKPRKKWKLYDLETDPLETSNLREEQPHEVDRLNDALLRWQGDHKKHHAEVVDNEISADQQKVLRSLGYTK